MSLDKATPTITEQLCDSFASAADALMLRRARDIPERSIEDFISLGWMRWYGGSLQITRLGQMVLVRIRDRFAEAVA